MASPAGPVDSYSIIELQLDTYLNELETKCQADVITYIGGILPAASDLIKEILEHRKSSSVRNKIAMILETEGGYIEVAERIARTLRHHYEIVEFIVPSYAMSAGTVLVMSGDAIHMDYYSVLGPIDPQVESKTTGDLIPAQGYTEQYQRLIDKASSPEGLSAAEITYLVQKFDPAELYRYEEAKKLSVSLLQEWLAKFKFKNWYTTATRGISVTPEMRKTRAMEIADKLGSASLWHSHSRGISMDVLRNDLNLKIEDFETNVDLNICIETYYELLKDYMNRRSHDIVLHVMGKYSGVSTSKRRAA